MELQDRLVVEKPTGWQVDGDVDPSTSAQARGLSSFLWAELGAGRPAILLDRQHQGGFLHRLDVPGSGLILAAKSYEAYYDLQLQLSSGALDRDYVVLCHGWAPASGQRDLGFPVWWDDASGDPYALSVVHGRGKPARTRVKLLARASYQHAALSLFGMRIVTGRRHQIRVQAAHVGHATVCDHSYTSKGLVCWDLQWCPRNFIHRYRLAFQAADGAGQEVALSLPPDLVRVLERLSPKDAAAEEALRSWAGGSAPPGWHELEDIAPVAAL